MMEYGSNGGGSPEDYQRPWYGAIYEDGEGWGTGWAYGDPNSGGDGGGDAFDGQIKFAFTVIQHLPIPLQLALVLEAVPIQEIREYEDYVEIDIKAGVYYDALCHLGRYDLPTDTVSIIVPSDS